MGGSWFFSSERAVSDVRMAASVSPQYPQSHSVVHFVVLCSPVADH